MTLKELSLWYGRVDFCLLTGGIYNSCIKLRKYEFESMCEATSRCRFTPSSLYQRPVGFETNKYNPTLLSNLMSHIHKQNRTLIFIGDSITRYQVTALQCALFREDETATFNPPINIRRNLWGHTAINASLLNGTLNFQFHYIAIWEHFGPYVLDFVKKVISKLSTDKNGVIAVANTGAHESQIPGLFNHTSALKNMFTWAESGLLGSEDIPRKKEKNNTFIYRETSAQHFPDNPVGLKRK